MRIVDIIQKKRDKEKLSDKELEFLLSEYLAGNVPDYQMSAFLMAMTLSMDDFVITFFVAGPGSSTLPLHIFSMIRFGVSPVINAISVVLIAGTFVLAFSSRNIQKYMFKK